MVTINTADDLLRALAENPHWKEAVRQEILTEELMNLPARFDRFVATTEAFMEEQRQVNATTAGFIAEQRQVNAEQKEFNATTSDFIAEQKEYNVRMERRVDRVLTDIGTLRADYARRNAISEAYDIAENMGFRLMHTLTTSDLWAMYEASDTAGISRGALQSFRRADLVIAAADADGATHYIAVEVSYTADERDTGRALRNVSFLTRFTGHPAHAAIASVRNDDRIRHLIDGGQIHWHQMEDRDHPVE